ncbi:hypothetical protein GOP47_0023713 [Adiantum capillus-veneris]|uniref:Mitochondrial adenine nucleotide transporter BTL3 n=1 Tax=Adiantum capillus-veneris TaxID=13818 RepID=A0A9D4Z3M2_ADICA|nr:hypothetical protein GOP47_0023713 [Adiantum capillus-veneris]
MKCRNLSSKGLVLMPSPEDSQYSILDEGSCSFPSVFSSPFTKASLCSFLLAMPASNQSPPSTAFSSLSTLAFLSISVSMKARNVSASLDESNPVNPASSLMATIATALRSFQPSGKWNEKNLKKSKGVFRLASKQLNRDERPVLGSPTVSRAELLPETAGLHSPGSGSMEKSTSELRAEKRASKIQSVSKYLVAGAVSTIVARTFVAPLERLKLEYIVGGAKHNWIKVMQGIWIAEGIAGFWKGNTVNLLRMVPFKSINFLTYDMFCKELLERQEKSEVTNSERLLAGAASGAAATLLCIPLDTVRTRLIAPGGDALGGMLGCFHQMIQKEGFLSLYKGLLPALLSMVPAGAVFYGVYDILKAAYLQSPKAQQDLLNRIGSNGQGSSAKDAAVQPELGPMRTLIYGAIAGACAETVTYPLEVVRRQLQLQQTAAKMGLITAFQTIIERDGFGALFSGVVPSTVQVLPSAALSYLVYEFMKSALKIS